MLNSLKEEIAQNFSNWRSWKTDSKIIVFESDDWGGIRIQSKKQFNNLQQKGFDLEKSVYDRIDGLERSSDLDNLFNILASKRNVNNEHPLFTTNMVMTNPNFDLIKSSYYNEFFYDSFDQSYLKYYGEDNFTKWNDAIANKLVKAQFHCREHLNIDYWLADLRKEVKKTIDAFDYEFFALKTNESSERENSYLATYNHETEQQELQVKKRLKDGLRIFQNRFKYNSTSFIASNYIWGEEIETFLDRNNVRYLQGQRIQKVPLNERKKYLLKRNYTGKSNINKQIYLVRNCLFEPFSSDKIDWVDYCLKQIENSFYWSTPAIICTHRANYTSAITTKVRDKSFHYLNNLLSKILLKWPDVIFLTSDELGDYICENT